MKVNVAKSAIQNILDLVNGANVGQVLTTAQVTVGNPSAVAGTAGRNTEVTLTAIADYTGTQTYAYTRRSIATDAVASTAPAKVDTLVDDTEAEAVAKVVTALGLVAGEFDISAYTAPVDESTDGSVTLTAKATSLLYTGVRVVVLSLQDVSLATATPVTDLDGFEAEA
ncbi:hypothetical protein D3C80_933280 [compost metagenome]